jgi:N-acetylgalactosamine-6-sulfatase
MGLVDSESVLSTVDLLPTFCGIVGADLPGSYKADGEVILDALQGNGHMRSKPLFWEWRFADSKHPTYWPEWAVLSDGWKMLHNTVSGHTELYNLKTDHEERIDLSGSMPDKVDHLKGLWSDWKQSLPE